jgi:HK97 gp10 family phage protein
MGRDQNQRGYAIAESAARARQLTQVGPVQAELNAATEKELRLALAKLSALGELATRRQRKAVLRKGATILRDEARRNVPVSAEPHKGRKGRIYYPGNLRDSIQVKSLRRSLDLFVGPRTNSSATASVFGEQVSGQKTSVDGYYAHFMEFDVFFGNKVRQGRAYMRRALASVRQQVAQQIVKDAWRVFDRIVKKAQAKQSA